MKIKTIIFDFDGVIADSLPMHFKKMVDFAQNVFGVKEEEKTIIDHIRSKSYFEVMKTFKISWTKIPLIMSLIHKAREELFFEIDKVKIFPGIKSSVKELNKKNIRLIILSSNLKKTIDKFLLLNKISEFDQVHSESNLFGKDVSIKRIMQENNLKK